MKPSRHLVCGREFWTSKVFDERIHQQVILYIISLYTMAFLYPEKYEYSVPYSYDTLYLERVPFVVSLLSSTIFASPESVPIISLVNSLQSIVRVDNTSFLQKFPFFIQGHPIHAFQHFVSSVYSLFPLSSPLPNSISFLGKMMSVVDPSWKPFSSIHDCTSCQLTQHLFQEWNWEKSFRRDQWPSLWQKQCCPPTISSDQQKNVTEQHIHDWTEFWTSHDVTSISLNAKCNILDQWIQYSIYFHQQQHTFDWLMCELKQQVFNVIKYCRIPSKNIENAFKAWQQILSCYYQRFDILIEKEHWNLFLVYFYILFPSTEESTKCKGYWLWKNWDDVLNVCWSKLEWIDNSDGTNKWIHQPSCLRFVQS